MLRFFGDALVRFFINDGPTVDAGRAMMHAFVWGLPFLGSQVTLMTSFQSFGKPVQAMIITMGRQFLFYIPLLYLLNYLFAFNGFIWAQPTADILTTGIALILSRPLFHALRGE